MCNPYDWVEGCYDDDWQNAPYLKDDADVAQFLRLFEEEPDMLAAAIDYISEDDDW